MPARTLPGLDMHRAAQTLGISRRKLFTQLKARGLFHANNTPKHDLIRAGLFSVELREFNNPVSGIRRQYSITLVTGAGLSWLQENLASDAAA